MTEGSRTNSAMTNPHKSLQTVGNEEKALHLGDRLHGGILKQAFMQEEQGYAPPRDWRYRPSATTFTHICCFRPRAAVSCSFSLSLFAS